MTIDIVKYCFLVILWLFVSFVVTLKMWVLYSAGVQLENDSAGMNAGAIVLSVSVFVGAGSRAVVTRQGRPWQ